MSRLFRGKPVWLLPCLLVLVVMGCTGGDSESGDGETSGGDGDRPSVAFVTNQIADFWKIAEAGAKDAGQEFDVDVGVVMPPEATAVVQKQKVEDLLAGGVQAIAVST